MLPYVVAILGLALLMVVHEGGHLLAARAFGMRVVKFSIGFGPTIFKHQPKGSETVYQVALIPFLAYVQIAGMNPFEDADHEDPGSYANASLLGRVTTIFAGPLANYLFASVLFFAALMVGGEPRASTRVNVLPEGAAAEGKLATGDRIVAVDGARTDDFEVIRQKISKSPGKPLAITVDRGGQELTLPVTPRPKGPEGAGLIGVEANEEWVPVTAQKALGISVVEPARIVAITAIVIGRMLTGQEKAQLSGPVGIVKETSKAAATGTAALLRVLAFISTSLAAFNLVPFPALDGGRLAFLGYEAVTRRRPNARIEGWVHALGLLMLLGVIAVVSVFDFKR